MYLKETIEDHIKLSSKSLLKKLYFDTIVGKIDENNTFSNFISEKFKKVNEDIIDLFANLNLPDNRIIINLDDETIDDIISSCIKITFYNENLSSSDSRMFLYKTINEYARKTPINKIIIIDDFDLHFDEISIKQFIEIIENDTENMYLLFSNKPESLPYILNKGAIFNIRERKIIELTNMSKMIRYILGTKEEKFSFEEYYINEEILVLNEEVDYTLKQIQTNSIINLGRMLVNKNYDFEKGAVAIFPSTLIEKKILLYIDELIKIE